MPLAGQERLRKQAAIISGKFKEIFLKFADVHRGINHTHAMNDDDIHRIGKFVFIKCQYDFRNNKYANTFIILNLKCMVINIF